VKIKLSASISIALNIVFLILLVSAPEGAAQAVKNAFETCTNIILPSLMPFFFISGMISALGIPTLLAGCFSRVMSKLFHCSGYAATPLLLGFLGGYPVGAAALCELVKKDHLSRSDGERLLPLCNNTGPAFIIGAVGSGIFSSSKVGIMLYCVHILAALSVGFVFSAGRLRIPETEAHSTELVLCSIAQTIPICVKSTVEKCLSICGFVVFFSVLNSLLEELGLITAAALFINKHFGIEIGFCRSFLAGIMELGSGIASMATLENSRVSYALASFILGFGSLSVHCQTLALASEANIKCARHFAGRILHGLLSAFYCIVLSSLLRI